MDKVVVERDRIRGKFNKDILLNSFFEHTDLFSPAAKIKLTTGKYCGEVFRSKKYNIFWGQEKERCIHGYTNPITKVYIPGPMYFFLNYKQLPIIEDTTKSVSRRKVTFPRFWPIHYHFINDYLLARQHGKNIPVLKPRGVGWSEFISCLGVWYYTFQTEDPVFFFASNQGYLDKSGIISKAWEQINFLNAETERAFKHLRQEKDQDLHKIASYWDPEKRVFKKTGGEIIGRVIDKVDKVRGARGHVMFEEGGSFPNLVKAWMTCWALVQQGGISFASMMVWGTGGEQGPGIAGLEEIFMHPYSYNCMGWENCWEEVESPNDHGFFFPTWAVMDRFMDSNGNTNYEKAIDWENKQREMMQKRSPHLYDRYIAEYPFTPSEAIMRLSNNPFPVSQLQAQLRRVDSSPDIQGVLKHGDLVIEEGEPRFRLNPKAQPIQKYPHDTSEGVEGSFTMFEAPLRDEFGNVPDNLYYLVADCFHTDTEQATDWVSLGAFYIYKRKNNLFPTEDDILVGWYSGRPQRVKQFHRLVFIAARLYNAKVQTEIKGGGQHLLDFAREHNFLHLCGERQTVFTHDRDIVKQSQRQYFIRMEEDDKKTYLTALADWLLTERALKVEGDKTRYILNLERIYDRALLEELIKFRYDGNFDRISCLLVLMATRQEQELKEIIEQTKQNRNHIFSRPIFSTQASNKGNLLSAREILGPRKTDNPQDLVI